MALINSHTKEFSPETVRALGYYVYGLIDSRKRRTSPARIFYVGKGKKQRCFQHAKAQVRWNRADEPNPKLKKIRAIRRNTGAPPPIEIFRHGMIEEDAYCLEAVLIDALQTNKNGNYNSVRGKHAKDFCLSVKEIEGRYAKPLPEAQLKHRVLLVSLNGGGKLPPFPAIKEADLPKRVLRYWTLSNKNADQVEYIIGVYEQLTRVVFKIKKKANGCAIHKKEIYKKNKKRLPLRRQSFLKGGVRCPEKEILWGNRRIVDRNGTILTKFPWQVGCRLIGKHSLQ